MASHEFAKLAPCKKRLVGSNPTSSASQDFASVWLSRAACGGVRKEKSGWRLRRNLSKLPKSLKKYRLEPYFTKENFY